MEKNLITYIFIAVLAIIINFEKSYCQATSGNVGNVRTPGDYIGWTNGTNATLVIKNEDDQPINFYTNAGNGTLNNLRMLIDSINGFIGMGRNFTAPQSILHINGTNNSTGEVFRTDGPTGNDQFWRMYRAGGLYGTLYNLAGARHFNIAADTAELRMFTHTNNRLQFYMRDTVRLLIDDTTGFTGVGHFTANYSPQNKLHIHDTLTGGAAYLQITNRATGTTPIGSRGVRLGLDNGGTVQLINGSTGNPTDFIMSGSATRMRIFWPSGLAAVQGNIGMGTPAAIANSGPRTVLNLHLPSDSATWMAFTDSLTGSGTLTDGFRIGINKRGGFQMPQAELWQDENAAMNFYTNRTFAMTIDSIRNVGIGTRTPGNRLEVDQGTAGNSGLRFTRLTSASTPVASNGRVLTLNANGDVILANDSIGTGGSGVSSTCTTLNFLPKVNANGSPNLTCSQIFDDGTRVGINKSTNMNYRFETVGTSAFTTTASPSGGFNLETTTHPLLVKSDGTNELGISILRGDGAVTGQYEDNFRIYNDMDGLTHFRTISTTAQGSLRSNVTLDHQDTYGSTDIWSWLGYSTGYRSTIIKDDFNTNANPNTTLTGLGFYGKFYVEALPSAHPSNTVAISAINTNSTPTTGNIIAVQSITDATRTTGFGDRNIGGSFRASGITTGSNVAVNAEITGAQSSTENFGALINVATSGTNVNNYGVHATVSGAATADYAIFATAGDTASDFAGFFTGDIYYSAGLSGPSDSILKTNVSPLLNASQILSQFKPLQYNFKNQQYPYLGFPSGVQYGFYAQAVEQFLPQAVNNIHYPGEMQNGVMIHPPLDFKGMDLTKIVPLLVAGYQELKAQLDACCSSPRNQGNNTLDQNLIQGANITEVQLTNSQTIILEQNVPNPFETETNISYNIPENISAAKIIFYSNNGTVLKEVEIKHRGVGTLKVYATELAAGIYNYSLVADGKVIDTKKMMKNNK